MINELACFSFERHYQFKLNVDIKKSVGRPLFQAFGKTIYKAEWIAKTGSPIVLVKIHGAKATREAAFYVRLSWHPRIVHTYGLIESDAESVMLVQERTLEGDLSERLRENEFRPVQAVLLEIFLQIIDAMICLADNSIVHGDLACRNVLIYQFHDQEPSQNSVKLTDFGLTRASTLFSVASSTVSTTLTVIPMRYAAPELIHDTDKPIYSEKSDIYSMGVLMWEALSRGQLPYACIEDDKEVCRRKLRGEILPKPENCDQALWAIITQCWQQRSNDRPTFKTLRETLSKPKLQPRLTWRDIIPVDSQFSPDELSHKIRQIYVLNSRSPPELIFLHNDEEHIGWLCFDACEPPMLQLLQTADAVTYLPMLIRNYVTTLNTLAREIEQLDLPDDRRCRLSEMLALRCKLLETGWLNEAATNVADNRVMQDNELLDDICRSHLSIGSFQALPYQQLESLYLKRCIDAQQRTLQTLWIGEDSLRRLIAKYNLPLITIQWLNEQNIGDIKMITAIHVNNLIQCDLEQARSRYKNDGDFETGHNIADLHDEFKATMRNFYRNEVIGRPDQYKKAMEQQRDKITEALNELSSIDKTNLTDKASLRQRLTDIGTRLHVSWHFSKEEMDHANELLGTIIQDLRLFQEILETSSIDRQPTDEELVTCIKEIPALHGVQLNEPGRKMFQPFLSQPTYTSLEQPSMTSNIKEFTFSNLEDSHKFIQTIKTSGISAATKIQLNLPAARADVEAHRTTDNLPTTIGLSSKQINSLVKLRCHVIPIHSFRLGKEQMKLSHEAKTASNLVTDLATARTFLSKFGSHISDGTQHVGGIFIHEITLETGQKCAAEILKHAATREWNASAQPGYRTYRCHISFAKQIDPERVPDESGNEQSVTVNHRLQPIGPTCENLELFQKILTSNRNSLFIIDRGAPSSFIPVWEIIDQLHPLDPTMHEIAEF